MPAAKGVEGDLNGVVGGVELLIKQDLHPA